MGTALTLTALGFAVVVAGIALIYAPAAVIVGGVGLLALGIAGVSFES